MEFLREIAKSVMELHKSVKASIDILNNKIGVEVANPFRVSMMEVLENDKKRMQW